VVDRFLGGRVAVRQTPDGFRSGLDAVMLAAAVPARAGDQVLELGAGSGAASLCLAARVADCRVTAVEIDAALAGLIHENAASNRAAVDAVCADVFALPPELKREYAHVFCNPPFHGGEASPDPARDRALRDTGRFADWMETGLKRTVSGGTFTTIARADRLGDALAVLPSAGIAIFPLWPRAGEAAKRVIVQATKGARAPLALLAGLVLHEADGRYTREADVVLRDGASLAMESRRL
jgi:tRNA1Val (adenine37-N6)-methyltransferase